MKMPRLLLATCLALVVSLHGEEDKPKTPLGRQMSGFDDLFKAMKGESDPAKGAVMAREAQLHLAASLGETPLILKDAPAGPARDLALAKYRRMVSQTLLGLCLMEEAYLKGDLKEVSRLRSGLVTLKEKGHEEFIEE